MFKQKAIKIFYEGNSKRAVGQLLKINKYTVYNCISKFNEKIEKQKKKLQVTIKYQKK